MKLEPKIKRATLGGALCVALSLAAATSTHAVTIVDTNTITPHILSGAPPDSAAARVDANVASSAFSGAVSINIHYDGSSFICSGAVGGTRQVLSAGHCVDTTGNRNVVDISQPFAASGKDVRVVRNNSNVAGPDPAVVNASNVVMNPDYKGFGNCPVGVPGFCVNDV